MNFKDNLKKYRESAGITSAKDFATALGIPYQTYLNYENKGTEPKYDTLCKIAATLGVTTDELLGYSFNEYDKYKRMVQRAGFFVVDNSNHYFEGSPRDEQVFVFYQITADDESDMEKVIFKSRADFIRILKDAYSIYSKNTEKILDREIGLAIQYQRSKNVHQE